MRLFGQKRSLWRGTTGLVNSEAEMLAFRSERAVWPGHRGARSAQRRRNRLIRARCCFPTHKKAQHIMLRVKNKGTPRDTVYPWGKGINKHKTNKQIKWVCLVKSAVYDVGQQGVLGILQIEDKQQSDAKCLQSYTRCITQAFASNRRTPTVRLGSRP